MQRRLVHQDGRGMLEDSDGTASRLGQMRMHEVEQDTDNPQAVMNTALDTSFSIPGDATFPLNQAFEPPRDRNEAEVLRQYLGQMRQELSVRLLSRVYGSEAVPSKVSHLGFDACKLYA